MDWDKNGSVSKIEFKAYLTKLRNGEELTQEELDCAFSRIDKDGSKNIQWEEFRVRKNCRLLINAYQASHQDL